MRINKQILAAALLMAVFAPAVRADLVADPNEFKQLKKYVTPKLKDVKKQAVEKTTEKSIVKVDAKTDGKVTVKANVKTSDKSKAKSATTASGEKSN
jgi:hypothetical protein